MKIVLTLIVFLLIPNAKASHFGSALKNQDGSILFLAHQLHAIQACNQLGQRLPTAREYAFLSMSRGSEGILEKGASLVPPQFYSVDVVNTDGISDNFYFSNRGYEEPNNEELKGHYDACYWTGSSEDHVPNLFGHIFDPTFGLVRSFATRSLRDLCAIRCVID